MKTHTINVSDEVYDYLKGMIEDAETSDEPYKPTFSEVISHLIEDREAAK